MVHTLISFDLVADLIALTCSKTVILNLQFTPFPYHVGLGNTIGGGEHATLINPADEDTPAPVHPFTITEATPAQMMRLVSDTTSLVASGLLLQIKPEA